MSKVNKFGTFGGVFVPSILTILGVIMYLRLPMIVGESGLYMTLGIILIAHIISVTTGLSVSSIATDKKVEAGGTYYMISRSLGLPIGGTLGLALFVGLSFSVSLYLIGFAESFLGYFGYDVNITTIRIAGTSILVLVTIVTFISTSLAIKTQYFIMAAIILSLLSIVLGSHDFVPTVTNLKPTSGGASFMLLFGIFFPAVTGFEAGVSMSGDLKDPKKSIPSGSISAIIVGLVVYIALAVFLSFTVDKNVLLDPKVLFKVSAVPELVIVGILGATLSSAFGSILGAPRILQATAVDKITPRFFSKGVGKSNEPRNALILTFLIAEAGILIGELDVIARIVSIFFITTYGFLNLSCAFEGLTSADFRPSFKVPAWVSLLGSAACFLVMIQLDFVATLGATFILGLLYFFLKRKELSLSSGDAWSGVWASLVKSGLKKLNKENLQSRNWRPNLMLFAGSEERRPHLTQLGLAIVGKLGLLSTFELIEEDVATLTRVRKEESSNGDGTAYFKHQYKCKDVYEGIGQLSNLYGFSGIEPNTVLMGWTGQPARKADFIELIKGFERADLNSLFLRFDPMRKVGNGKTIDIWWSGWGRNLSLAMNLITHLTTVEPWRQASVRLLVIHNQAGEIDRIYQQIQRILTTYRFQITLKVLNNFAEQNPKEHLIATESAKTDLTIVGIPDRSYDELESTYDYVSAVGKNLGTCLFINASSNFEEHNIISEAVQTELPEQEEQHQWVLPDLEVSKYEEVATDIAKIDEFGKAVIKVFVEKTFKAYYQFENRFNEKLRDLVSMASKAIVKSASVEQKYKQAEAIVRTRRHFIENVKKLLVSYQENDVKQKAEVLQTGIDWYLGHLEKDVNRFPKRLTIPYDKAEFYLKKKDSFGLKWFKLQQRLTHPFAKKSIPVTVRYREVASHFLRDNRYHFVSILMRDFHESVKESLRLLSDYISFCEVNFERFASKQEAEDAHGDMVHFAETMSERMEQRVQRSAKLLRLYEGRIQLEFRKNLSQMAHYLERIRVNEDLGKKRRGSAFYQDKKLYLREFSETWEAAHKLSVNSVIANAHLLDFLGRLEKELQQFRVKLNQWIVRESSEPVEEIKASLLKLKDGPIDKRQPIVSTWNIDGVKLLDDFEVMSDRLLSYAKTLPDEINVAADEGDGELTIPLNSLLIHLVEIRLAGPFYDYLEGLQDQLRQSSLLIQDQANLSIFNVFNADEEERERVASDIITADLKSIEAEQSKMTKNAEASFEELSHLLSELRDALHITSLTANVGEFAQLIRKHRSKQITSRFGEAILTVRRKAKELFVGILYSQSKGVLLAKRFTDVGGVSFSEKLLKTIDSVTPNQALLQNLPHYYSMLFSGRSSISDNFWVPRAKEESELQVALTRYRTGMSGMIVVLGERNSGKTVLCKHFCERNFLDDRVYHIFSRDAGSANPEDFTVALQKATRIEGDSDEVFSALVHGSVIVVHDMELWWERADVEGLKAIQHIKSLIDKYSNKCLFIVNMNPFAYEILTRTEALDTFSIGTIRCQPFNAFDLRRLILSRHKSSGITYKLGRRMEQDINEIGLARLFTRIFEYSNGNPGMAMNAWLCAMQSYRDMTIEMKLPSITDISVLHNLPTEWNIISLQFLLHKRMSLDKLCRVLGEEKERVRESLRAMVRVGVIKSNNMQVFGLNPYIEFLMIKVFHEKEWL